MNQITVGEKWTGAIAHADGVYFNADGAGYTLLSFFDKPDEEEIRSLSAGAPFEIRFEVFRQVLVLTIKAGTLEVMDAYFAPQLAPNVSVLIRPQEGGTEGSALTSILVDRRSGIVKALRVIGLGNRFSCDLYDTIQEQLQRPFSTGDYFGKIDQIQMTYSSDQLFKLSTKRFKVRND